MKNILTHILDFTFIWLTIDEMPLHFSPEPPPTEQTGQLAEPQALSLQIR